ncbi:MAG: hypothetical protein KGO82_04135 [Bacteroidota bacterium]|nr:hypothetical protein [Bacteroidota bacterium]
MASLLLATASFSQDSAQLKSITQAEYDKAKTFTIKDLDKDSYVKFENTWILDRYEGRKPYFITGDDGLKKRIDLYRLLRREGRAEIGTLIFYTNEKGEQYRACLPNFRADGKIWEKYFEDIHAIDRKEANFVLKLSYVLSREFGFQLYKAANQGKDLGREEGTYGMDICFPGDMEVAMANGTKKLLRDLKTGDEIVSVDPATHRTSSSTVKELVRHEAKNYAISQLVLITAQESASDHYIQLQLSAKMLNATPNHPMQTEKGIKPAGSIVPGDVVLCLDRKTNQYRRYTVWSKTEQAGGVQPVYNIETTGSNGFMLNEVMVLQKGQ